MKIIRSRIETAYEHTVSCSGHERSHAGNMKQVL